MRWLILAAALICSQAQAQTLNTLGAGSAAKVSAAAYQGPGDIVSGAYVFWGFRAYNAAYATGSNKAANICDAATGAVCSDVNILSTGYFDAAGAAALAQCSVACEVAKLYDQTGNSRDISVAFGNRPTLTFNAINTYACATFLIASSQRLGVLSSLDIGVPYTYTIVVKRSAAFTTAQGVFYGTTATPASGGRIFYTTSNNTLSFTAFESSTSASITTVDGSFNAIQATGTGTPAASNRNQAKTNIDGTTATASISGSNTNNFTGLTLGTAYNGTSYSAPLSGVICETGVWNADIVGGGSTAAMNTNMHAAYGGW